MSQHQCALSLSKGHFSASPRSGAPTLSKGTPSHRLDLLLRIPGHEAFQTSEWKQGVSQPTEQERFTLTRTRSACRGVEPRSARTRLRCCDRHHGSSPRAPSRASGATGEPAMDPCGVRAGADRAVLRLVSAHEADQPDHHSTVVDARSIDSDLGRIGAYGSRSSSGVGWRSSVRYEIEFPPLRSRHAHHHRPATVRGDPARLRPGPGYIWVEVDSNNPDRVRVVGRATHHRTRPAVGAVRWGSSPGRRPDRR